MFKFFGFRKNPVVACKDCGKPYGAGDWHDVVIPNDTWKIIAPEGGILCANCMVHRMAERGINEITIKIF